MNIQKRTLQAIGKDFGQEKPLSLHDKMAAARWLQGGAGDALPMLSWLAAAAPSPALGETFAARFHLGLPQGEALVRRFLADGKRPAILALEGLDGSGKTVQAELLRRRLEAEGIKLLSLDFPQYQSFFGREIGALLSGEAPGATAMELDAKSMCLWYAADRWRALSGRRLSDYGCVLFNRYTLSNAVYQTARRCRGLDRSFVEWIFRLEYVELQLPIPDLYLYLETSVERSQGNVLKKEPRSYVAGADVYERSDSLLARCAQLYRQLAEEDPGIRLIPCCAPGGDMRSAESIHRTIMASIGE